jgi:hypothetical protein
LLTVRPGLPLTPPFCFLLRLVLFGAILLLEVISRRQEFFKGGMPFLQKAVVYLVAIPF